MKTSNPILLLTTSSIILAVCFAHANEPGEKQSQNSNFPLTLPRASVEMPWTEFQSLWDKAQNLDHPTPLLPDHAIWEARFVLDWNVCPEQIAATWVVENFDSQPRWVTILPLGAALAPQKECFSPVSLSRGPVGVAFLLSQKGQATLDAVLLATREGGPDGREVIRFPLGSSGITVLEIHNLPEGFIAQIADAMTLKNDGEVHMFVLPTDATEAAVEVKPSVEKREAVWELQCEAVVQAETASLNYTVRVSANLLSAQGKEFRLPVPVGMGSPQIKAQGVESWNIVEGDAAARWTFSGSSDASPFE